MADATFTINQHEQVEIVLPSGRKLNVWCCDHDDHESIDVWLTDGTPSHPISERTGATDRAPMGVFGFVNGARAKLHDTGFTEHKWPAVSTIVLMFDKPDVPNG